MSVPAPGHDCCLRGLKEPLPRARRAGRRGSRARRELQAGIPLHGSLPCQPLMTISGAAAPNRALDPACAMGQGLGGSPADPPQSLALRNQCWDAPNAWALT